MSRPSGVVFAAYRVRAADRAVIDGLGLPGVALMEVAARGVATAVRAHHGVEAKQGTVVVCGSGNNGGDGWAVARWLHGWGLPVSVWAVQEPRTAVAQRMAQVAKKAGVREVAGLQGAGLVVDALLGTGLTRPVEGRLAEVVEAMSAHGAPVVAVDVPSGLHADRGVACGVAVQATRTVTFGHWKPGLFGAEAARCGVVELVDIGLGAAPVAGSPDAVLPREGELAGRWPRRGAADHKTRSGHVLVIAGSWAMAGAAVLACSGALSVGAGLVTLAVPDGAVARMGALPPEVMVLGQGEGRTLTELPPTGGYDAVVVGPGLGGGAPVAPELHVALRALWGEHPGAVLFDADALPATHEASAPAARVLTPHPGEAARLLGTSVPEVQADRFTAARTLARRGVVLLKGPHTLVAQAGEPVSINPTGHPALATGGSGDVLAGVVGGLLARGVAARAAATLGAWVHGVAGERLAARVGEGWRASQIAREIPHAVDALRASR